MTRWYGNLTNRLEEGRTVPEIKEGMDITMYHWSDRTCYWVEKVDNQKRIQVREYHVCADHSIPGGMGHQNWKYFKTINDMNKYLDCYFPGTYKGDVKEPEPETWVFRYGKWKREYSYDAKSLDEKNMCGTPMRECVGFTEKELEKIENGGSVKKYHDLYGNVSFGKRDYYYDWSF